MIADETHKNRRAALGSEHQELLGDHGTKPYRRERINTADFALPLTCAFSVDADSHGPWSVLARVRFRSVLSKNVFFLDMGHSYGGLLPSAKCLLTQSPFLSEFS